MKIPQSKLSRKQRRQKLSKLASPTTEALKARVYTPPLPQKRLSEDLSLVGYFFPETAVSNIVDFAPFGNSSSALHYPFFNRIGANEIGLWMGPDTQKLVRSRFQSPISELLIKHPMELIGFLVEQDNYWALLSTNERILGFQEENETCFFRYVSDQFTPCETIPYTLELDVFSRNTGILETSVMKNRKAIISGCGSVGSLVALELARAGVGHFLLIDNDTLDYANICRHQCNIADVGRYKTAAVADRIHLINPGADVQQECTIIENVPGKTFEAFCTPDTIIVGCADNRQGDLYASKLATYYGFPMVSIGFWERAFAGEIFYWYPENENLACYHCFTNALGELSGRQSVNRRFYTTEEDLTKVHFMPGISADISFVTNIGIKISLDLLNRNDETYIPRVLDNLTQFTLVANTNKPEIGGKQAEMFSYPLQVTTSIEVQKRSECPYCGNSTVSHDHWA